MLDFHRIYYEMMSTVLRLLYLGTLASLTKQVILNCGDTSQRAEVHCTCFDSGGKGVAWLVNGNAFTTCVKPHQCIPSQAGYTFLVNSSADLYGLTINSHSYSQCGVYECRDISNSSIVDTVEISITDTYPDMYWEPEMKTEPGNYTDGTFSVTTPCLFDVNNVEIKWYTIVNGSKTVYVPEKSSTKHIYTYCQACQGVPAAKIETSFVHRENEFINNSTNDVRFVLEVYDSQNTSNGKSIPFSGLYTLFVPPAPVPECGCLIIIIIIIVITRLQYAQTWISGYSLYTGRNKIKQINNVECVEIISILLTIFPCIGLISCVWAYFKRRKGHTCPKWFKRALATGFIAGCIQPGVGLFITGVAYAIYEQCGSALFYSSVLFILLVGTEVALIIACTVLDVGCYYYILISAAYILVWIIAAVIMVIWVYKIYTENRKKAVLPITKGMKTTKDPPKKIDDSRKENLKNERKANPPVTQGKITTKESKDKVLDFGNENLNDCTCDLCGLLISHTLKGFCVEQNMFLCNSCLSNHNCNGKHLKHNQHEESGREKYFPCERKTKKGHRNLPAHGYCLECMLYLCTECLINHSKHDLLWMPHHDAKTLDDICCFKTQLDRNSTIPLGFCKTCKMYICEECISRHNETHKEKPHIIIFHQYTESQSITGKCSRCSEPSECYKLNVDKYLCADCYDSDRVWAKNKHPDENSKNIIKGSTKCQLHNEVSESPAHYSPTDVFCIVCNLYLCKECFKVHRRFREHWIATHRENLFTCKGCQESKNVFPVECYSIDSKTFVCALCFEERNTTSKLAMEKYFRPGTITRLSEKPDCELHRAPFQCEERNQPSTVYCLFCKTYMCDDCFKKHLRLKQLWTKDTREMKLTCQIKFKNNDVSPIRM